MGKTCTGVDIGESSIKLAVCEGDVVKKVVVESLPEGLVVDGRIVSRDAMADFIKSLAKSVGGVSRDVALVLPAADNLVRRLTLPAMAEKELKLNLPYEFRDYIAQGKDRYLYDYAVLSMNEAPDGTPETMDLLAVASPRQTIADFEELFRCAGLRLRVALPEQAAFQNLIRKNPIAFQNCCVIDFSYRATKLHFFLDGMYDVARSIEIGGMDIDRALARERGVDEHVAVKYKLADFEDAQHSEEVRSIYASIAVELGRALNFYSFNNPTTAIEVAYCCGGGALLEPLMETVDAHTNIELRPIIDLMPFTTSDRDLRALCPAAVGATRNAR
ncbi:pilus assembly protein PilM [Paraeggerthella hongkongensis]|uniref:Pilus assembly protein PilM n=1 Tax=Paraeggerthella hongkongensis TaxID=230658 RepID=A0A3N0BGN3_9ACTN|nr:pilus assembly protein PilM [Paraeggerthella hongkongensis]RNL47085.1 pilus assembly protein PilM [Paraeggerthella hongkongensis]